jgi:hypothetical protein
VTAVFIGTTEIIIAGLFGPRQQDEHMKALRWHRRMVQINPDYLADIAARQAAKRAAGVGPEGRCHA